MTEKEKALSMSTPHIRFDVAATPASANPTKPATPEAIAQVGKIVSDNPVVLFALEWCEFCWSVRKLFAEAGIEHQSVDLDSVAYQKDGIGTDLRAALRDVTGVPTIPQVFVGGQHVGGATETFDAFNDGSLHGKLSRSAMMFNAAMQENAYSFLPKWLHPR